MPRPLPLEHPRRAGFAIDQFVISKSNQLALAMISDWRSWSGGKMLLTGPKGSGKTHLTHIWAEQCGARVANARDLVDFDIPSLALAPVAVEDVQQIAGDEAAETALFHLHNLLRQNGQQLLLTGEGVPNAWPITLPDLKSRVMGAQGAVLDQPDDTLLAAVLSKMFTDRQLAVDKDVIAYLVMRMDRSFDAAQDMVDALDAASLSETRPITKNLARDILTDQFDAE
jgi:DnaA regulatory inactivator Hda